MVETIALCPECIFPKMKNKGPNVHASDSSILKWTPDFFATQEEDEDASDGTSAQNGQSFLL